jgi:Cys-tRNA synthase (O-phospho-L-seryl-tRNA:Cys-tRNA synthase)
LAFNYATKQHTDGKYVNIVAHTVIAGVCEKTQTPELMIQYPKGQIAQLGQEIYTDVGITKGNQAYLEVTRVANKSIFLGHSKYAELKAVSQMQHSENDYSNQQSSKPIKRPAYSLQLVVR